MLDQSLGSVIVKGAFFGASVGELLMLLGVAESCLTFAAAAVAKHWN